MAFFSFVRATKLPTPGAMEYGFESEMLAFRPWIGPAIAARYQFASLGKQQSYQAASLAWNSGLTGVVHGQSALQPLSNPYV